MLLAIDIGNTNISSGVFKNERLLARYSLSTRANNYSPFLKKIFSKYRINDVIICSVVPYAERILEKNVKKLFGKPPYVLNKNIRAPIKNLYRKPRQVGQDRLVNAYAGTQLFGASLIVVDFGTAITFDVISEKKEYLGGIILPGLEASLDALANRTALLPRLTLSKPAGGLIGRDTQHSILSGIIYGFSTLTDGLVKQLKEKLKSRVKVIGTGGNIDFIGRYCRQIKHLDRDLTLKGLNLIYRHKDR